MSKQLKILLIEDNKHIVMVEKMCLEANDYKVTIAFDGLQGLDLAINTHPDLILLDLLIPKLDGFMVLEALQNNPSTAEIPILITSAKAQMDDLKQAFLYKIRGYMVKPFSPKELLLKIKEIMDSEGNKNG